MRALRIFAVCAALGAAAFGQTLPATAPAIGAVAIPLVPPDAAAQMAAREMIQKIFKVELARKSAADRIALATRYIGEAMATKEETAARYVLLVDAIDLASGAGDAAIAGKGIAELNRLFAVDALPMKRDAASRAMDNATAEQAEGVTRFALQSAEEAALADRFDLVKQLTDVAEGAGNKTRRVAFVASIQGQLGDLRQLAAEFPDIQRARARIAENPDDADARLALGRFYALKKGQWTAGLEHLAKCGDDTLRKLAIAELTQPIDGLQQAALADGWWELAAQLTGRPRENVLAHAKAWYQTASKTISGITLARIKSRLSDVPGGAADTPASATVKSGVELLNLIDPAKDAGEGKWSLAGGALSVEQGRDCTLQLPYFMAGEYDVNVGFTRVEGTGPVVVLLTQKNRAFGFELDVKGEARFERVANKIAKDNPTGVAATISNGRRYELRIEVRNDGVKAFLDEKLLTQWKTDFKDMSRYAIWKLPDDKFCGIGATNAKVTFHSVRVADITGVGKAAR